MVNANFGIIRPLYVKVPVDTSHPRAPFIIVYISV